MVRFSASSLPKGKRQRAQVKAALDKQAKTKQKITHRPEQRIQKQMITTANKWPMREFLSDAWDWEFRKQMLGPYVYHIANQRGDEIERMHLGSMGVRAGVWDLFNMIPILKAGRFVPGAYYEVKYENNGLSDKQVEFRTRALVLGYAMYECRSDAEFQAATLDYFEGALPAHGGQ